MFFNFFFVTKLIKFLIFIQHTINFYDKNFHTVEIKYFDSFIYLKKKGKNIFKIKKNSVINNDSLSIYFPTFFFEKNFNTHPLRGIEETRPDDNKYVIMIQRIRITNLKCSKAK